MVVIVSREVKVSGRERRFEGPGSLAAIGSRWKTPGGTGCDESLHPLRRLADAILEQFQFTVFACFFLLKGDAGLDHFVEPFGF